MGIPATFLHARFVRALPQKKGSQRVSRPPEQAFFHTKVLAGVVRNKVVAAVERASRAVAAAGAAARVEVAAAEKEEIAPVVSAAVATETWEDLLATVGDATGGAT